MKTCSKCGTAFEPSTKTKGNRCAECRQLAHRIISAKWRAAHRDELRAKWRADYYKNPQRYRAQQAKRYAAKRTARAATHSCLTCGVDIPPSEPRGSPRRSCDRCKSWKSREWADLNREKLRNARRKHDWSKQGISMTVELYNEILALQGGRCAICRAGKPTRDPRKKNLCVDHDREFGHVRGLLCVACNTAIGALKHSPTILRAAAKYLESHQPKLKLADTTTG